MGAEELMGRRNRIPPDALEIRVDALALGGEGIARSSGKACFVRGVFPGEIALAVPTSRRKSYDRLRLLEIVEPSMDRLPPLCPHAGVCGGCVLQQLRYGAQLEAKASQVREVLRRLGRIEANEPDPPFAAPVRIGYRNKMEFTFSHRAWDPAGPPQTPGPNPALGLHVPGRFDAVFDLRRCVLPDPEAVRVLDAVRTFARERSLTAWDGRTDQGILRHLVIRHGLNTGEMLAGLVVRHTDGIPPELGPAIAAAAPSLVGIQLLHNPGRATVAQGEVIPFWGRPVIRERLLDLTFELRVESFFQTSTPGAEMLLRVLRATACGVKGRRLLDLYCGVGTLGLALAASFEEILGVEQVPGAVEDARRNALLNGIGNARFLQASVEDWIRDSGIEPGHYDTVLVDPPRAGLHPRALEGILRLLPGSVLYVSCNPATLARDAARLRENGYEPRSLRILDLFPQTAHVECILHLQRG